MNRIDELLLVAYAHKDEEIRTEAGLKAIEECAGAGLYDTIMEMAVSDRLPEKTRIAAGERMIRMHAERGDYEALFTMSNNEKLARAVKAAAERKIEDAAIRAIKENASKANHDALFAMTLDGRLPERIRDMASMELEERAFELADKHKLHKASEGPQLKHDEIKPSREFLNGPKQAAQQNGNNRKAKC